MFVRGYAYTHGWCAALRPANTFIVSIGNLSVGGSGKTPLTELLTGQLLALDKRVSLAILSRGYKSKCDRKGTWLIFKASSSCHITPEECGDEPYLLAKRLPGIWFGIGRKRIETAEVLSKKGVRFFILDDGFAHRRLQRDMDVVLLDAENPFENFQLLPRGKLREAPKALQRASVVVLYPVQSHAQFMRSSESISPFTSALVVGMALKVVGAYALDDSPLLNPIPLSQLTNAPAALFCGIARPERFIDTVVSLGCRIVAQEIFADHEAPTTKQLSDFCERAAAAGACFVLCTEKDAAKCSSYVLLSTLPLIFLRIELVCVERKEQWDQTVQAIFKRCFK